jgi:hypothetical protein
VAAVPIAPQTRIKKKTAALHFKCSDELRLNVKQHSKVMLFESMHGQIGQEGSRTTSPG